MKLQVIASYLDFILFLCLGIAGFFLPHKLVRAESQEEKRKKIRVVRIASIAILVAALGRLALKLI